jgi:hypothetical protein
MLLALGIIACCAFQGPGDGFKRERNGTSDAAKNAYEGKAPPAFKMEKWMNWSGAAPASFASMKGKVILLDFWAFW